MSSDESLLVIVKTLLSSDMEPQVIRVCLDFIDQLSQPIEGGLDKEIVQGMKVMKKDLLSLCFNTNPNIASKAFRFIKAHISALEVTKQEIEQLCHLVFYDEEGVAAVAADFIDTMFFDGKLLNDVITNDEFVFLGKQDESKDQLVELAKLYELLNPGQIQDEKIEKFAKAFLRKTQIIFDFQGIITLVIDQRPLKISKTKLTKLSHNERKILLRFALATIRACKSCLTSNFPHEKNFKSNAEKILAHASDVIRYRAQELLTNLKLEDELLTILLPIFEETDLTLFFGTDNEDNYEAFLATLDDIFQINKDAKVIECIAMLYAKLETIPIIERDIQEILARSCKSLLRNFEENFQDYLDDIYIDKKENKGAAEGISETLTKFNKLSIYFVIEELSDSSILTKIIEALDTFISKYPVHTDFAIHSLNIFFYVHLWKLKNLLTKTDIIEDDLTEYAKIRDKLFEKLLACFLIDEQMKKLTIPQEKQEEVKNNFKSLEETSFTLIVETLCIVSADKFNKVQFLFYQPRPQLLKALQDYIIKLDANSTPFTQSQLFNSTSKKLVQGIRKSKFLARDDDSDSEKDEEDKMLEDEIGEIPEKKSEIEEIRQSRKRVIDQKEGEFFDERLQFACSLVIKLLMQCPRILLTDFGVAMVTHFVKSPHENMETLSKVLLKRLKTQEIDDHEGSLRNYYWRVVDGVIFKLYHDGDLMKACEIARTASKLYFEKVDKLDARKQLIISEKYLKYLVNCVLFAISSPKYYDLMGVLIILTNKNYLDKGSYQKILALFEVELKENQKKEEQKAAEEIASVRQEGEKIEEIVIVKDKSIEEQGAERKDEGDNAMEIVEIKEQIVEVAQATPSKQTADKGKSDYLDRFRQHMCKITGLKYKKESKEIEKEARRSMRIKEAVSTAKKSARKIYKETKENEEIEEEEKKEQPRGDESDKENQDENITEIKMDKNEVDESEKEKGQKGKKKQVKKIKNQPKPAKEDKRPPQNSKKRKERVYEVEETNEKEKEEILDMVKGKQKTKKMKQTVR